MADTESVNRIMTGSHVLGQDTLIITDGSGQGIEGGVSEEDILQQALEEASESLAQDTGYTADDDTVAEQLVQSVAGGEFENATSETPDDASFDAATYAIVSGENLTSTATSTVFVSENGDSNSNADVISVIPQHSQGLSVRLVPANEGSGAPLGSSQNPIRIIQQGNQYTPVQQLTTEQLQQIMQVVQQQQVAKDTSTSGQSILYNPQTNTKIVYRVIYPSELHKSGSLSIKQSQGQQTVVLSQIPKRTYKKRNKEEEDRYDGPELSKEEKEERKKHRPRTRSGRISKPPKHMVKDYKHIHVLDFDEEAKGDDSDGGYSDFKYSEDEGEKEDDDSYVHPGLGIIKPKNWKCPTCHRSYIGRGGLGRHYRLFPDHGSIDDHPEETTTSVNIAENGLYSNPGNMSEDSNTQDSTSSTPPKLHKSHVGRPPLNRRGGYRGRHRFYHDNPVRRKNKLMEMIKDCEDEELMEIVLPRLAKAITLWEFLLMKVEKGSPMKPRVDEIYKEFEILSKEVKKMCSKYLLPVTDTEIENSNSGTGHRLKVQNSGLAEVLGLNIGTYEVKNVPENDPTTFQYKLLTTDPSSAHSIPGQGVKRTVEFATHDQLVTQSPSKKVRTSVSLTSGVSTQTSLLNNSGRTSRSSSSKQSVGQVIHVVQPSQPLTVQSATSNHVQLLAPGTELNPIKSSNQMAAVSSSSPIGNAETITVITNSHAVGNNVSLLNAATGTNQAVKVSLLPASLSNYSSGGNDNIVNFVQTNSTTSLNGSIPSSNVAETPKNSVISVSGGTINSVSHVPVNKTVSRSSHNVTSSANQIITSSSTHSAKSTTVVLPIEIAANSNSISQANSNHAIVLSSSNAPISTVNLLSDSNQSILMKQEDQTLLNSVVVDSVGPGNGVQSTDTDQLVNSNIEIVKANPDEKQQTEMVQLVEDQIGDNQVEGIQLSTDQVTANIYQTADGIIIIQNPDGSTVQLQGGDGEPIPLETVQALLAMDDGQLLQTTEVTDDLG